VDIPSDGIAGAADDAPSTPGQRPLTFASLGVAVAVCLAWYAVVVTGYFAWASGRSSVPGVPGCAGADCPSERTAMLTLGFLGLLPTALVSLLASLVVLVFAARRLRAPVPLGTVSALAGMVLGVIGFVTIATYEYPRG